MTFRVGKRDILVWQVVPVCEELLHKRVSICHHIPPSPLPQTLDPLYADAGPDAGSCAVHRDRNHRPKA
jgi:hypothetical protein